MFSPFRTVFKDVADIPAGVKLISVLMALRTFGWGFADPFFSIFIQQFSGSYTAVGFFLSLMGFVALLTLVPLLRLADHVKDTQIFLDGQALYLLVAAGYTAAGFTHSVPVLVGTLMIHGIAQPMLLVGAEAYISKHSNGGSATAFGLYIAMDCLGWVLGMLVAAFTVQWYGLNYMFLFVLPSVFASLFLVSHIHDGGLKSYLAGLFKYFRHRSDFEALAADMRNLSPRALFLLAVSFFDGVVQMFSYVFIPLLAVSLRLGLKEIALLMAVMYLPFLFSFFFSEVADRFSRSVMIACGLLLTSAAFFLLRLMTDPAALVVLAALLSLSMAIVRPSTSGALARLTP